MVSIPAFLKKSPGLLLSVNKSAAMKAAKETGIANRIFQTPSCTRYILQKAISKTATSKNKCDRLLFVYFAGTAHKVSITAALKEIK